MKKFGAAIIGCGAIYKNHADAIANSAYGELIALVDIEEEKAKEGAKKYNCKYYVDYKVMLDNPEIKVVHICTPHYLHGQMAIDAMRAGKSVVLEKPVALNPEEAEEVAKVAKETNQHITVCFQNRYNPTSLEVKRILEEGTLGYVKGIKGIVTWFRDEEYYTKSYWRGKWATEGGGVLINQSIHTLDLMQWFGGAIDGIEGNVATRTLKHIIEVEDTADATLYYKNSAIGIFYATNSFTTDAAIEVEIHCEKGTLRINEGTLVRSIDGHKEIIATDEDSKSAYKSYWGLSHKKLIEDFYKAIEENDRSRYISVGEASKALKLIQGIYKASNNKEYVNLEEKL
jgi:predicted dehydrogenase